MEHYDKILSHYFRRLESIYIYYKYYSTIILYETNTETHSNMPFCFYICTQGEIVGQTEGEPDGGRGESGWGGGGVVGRGRDEVGGGGGGEARRTSIKTLPCAA